MMIDADDLTYGLDVITKDGVRVIVTRFENHATWVEWFGLDAVENEWPINLETDMFIELVADDSEPEIVVNPDRYIEVSPGVFEKVEES